MADTYTKTYGVGGKTITVSTKKTLAAAGDYSAEDVLSESATNTAGTDWDFVGIAKVLGGGGYITKAIALCSTTALTPRLALYLYNTAPTSELDDNAGNAAVSTTDATSYVGRIDFPAMEDLGGVSEAVVTPATTGNSLLSFNCTSADSNLYGILVTRDAITGEAAGMTMTVILTAEPTS